MPNIAARVWKVALILCALPALLWVSLVFSSKARLAVVRAYFKVESRRLDNAPTPERRAAIGRFTDAMCRVGLLRPVRMKADLGISFLLDPRDLVAVTILRSKQWQPEVWESLSPMLSQGGVLLDVGAHIGYFSLKASLKVGEKGRVVAFEPNPETVALLRENVRVNQASNVVVEPVACTSQEQMLTLYAAPGVNTGASSLAIENASVSGARPKSYSVRGRPIDDIVRELRLERVDAMKVDVEGAEVSVLNGAADTLRRFHPRVVIEVSPAQLAAFHTTPDDIAAALKAAGYNHSKAIDETDWEWNFVGPSNAMSVLRAADLRSSAQFVRGFHRVEQNFWRWTEASFAVELRRPEGADRRGARLRLHFTLPEISVRQLGSVTLSARIGSVVLSPQTFGTVGNHEYRRDVPASALKTEITTVEFSLDKSLPPAAGDPRAFGVIVTSVSLETVEENKR